MENQSTIMCDKISVSSSTSSNKVRSSSDSLLEVSDSKHGRSKAQLCLHKIIAVILSGSSEKEKKFEDNHEKKKKGFGFDLNLSLGCFGTYDDNWFSSDSSGVIGGGDCINNGGSNVEFTSGSILVGNGESECDLKQVDVIEVEEEEERRELSEVTDLKTPEIEDVKMEEMVVEKREMKKNGEEGYMDLLVEAARLISGDFKDESHETDEEVEETKNRDEKSELKRRRSKRNIKLDVYEEDFEDISPVVKSKRGRNQVLPLKYRDSVLDPWKSTTSMRSFKRVSNRNRN